MKEPTASTKTAPTPTQVKQGGVSTGAPGAMPAAMHGLIIAGGMGTRLWPASRRALPKQLLALGHHERTLLQSAFERFARSIPPDRIKVVTGADHGDAVVQQIREIYPEFPARNVLREPQGRDSGPAVLWGVLQVHHEAPDAVLAVVWCDQSIRNEHEFDRALALGANFAAGGGLVAIGVRPTRPETGLGYIECGHCEEDGVFAVQRFTEKPDLPTAQQFLAQGHYVWNAGLFAFNAATLVAEFERHAPELMGTFRRHHERQAPGGDWLHPQMIRDIYAEVGGNSLDYLLLEHTDRLHVVPADLDWSDLGAWNVLYQEAEKDAAGNAIHGNVLALSTQNSYIHGGRRLVATVGVKDLIVVDTADALLICDMHSAQDVKKLVDTLTAASFPEVAAHATTHRPWGSFTVLQEAPGYKIKILEVSAHQKLSLQSHTRRHEHWVVVEGEVVATRGEEELPLGPNDTIHIPLGAKHRIENPGEVTARLIEVQYGDYLGEDDIVRYEDVYGRS